MLVFLRLSYFFINLYEKTGPKIKRTRMDIALPISEAERDMCGGIERVDAEKTVIASEIPRPAGVIETRMLKELIALRKML